MDNEVHISAISFMSFKYKCSNYTSLGEERLQIKKLGKDGYIIISVDVSHFWMNECQCRQIPHPLPFMVELLC